MSDPPSYYLIAYLLSAAYVDKVVAAFVHRDWSVAPGTSAGRLPRKNGRQPCVTLTLRIEQIDPKPERDITQEWHEIMRVTRTKLFGWVILPGPNASKYVIGHTNIDLDGTIIDTPDGPRLTSRGLAVIDGGAKR